jgi:hypothetical protein
VEEKKISARDGNFTPGFEIVSPRGSRLTPGHEIFRSRKKITLGFEIYPLGEDVLHLGMKFLTQEKISLLGVKFFTKGKIPTSV